MSLFSALTHPRTRTRTVARGGDSGQRQLHKVVDRGHRVCGGGSPTSPALSARWMGTHACHFIPKACLSLTRLPHSASPLRVHTWLGWSPCPCKILGEPTRQNTVASGSLPLSAADVGARSFSVGVSWALWGLSSILGPTHSMPASPLVVASTGVPRHCPASPGSWIGPGESSGPL